MSSCLCCVSPRMCQMGGIGSLQPPTGSNNAPHMRHDFNKRWPKKVFFHGNVTSLTNTLEKVWDAGKESGKYHLLLMLLSTFGVSLGSTALRHCITIRWLSVGSATDGIWLKTSLIFELPNTPERKVYHSWLLTLWSLYSLRVITLLEDVD